MPLLLAILALFFLPLVETMNSLPAHLSWRDPLSMHVFNDYLRVTKWIMINIGFGLLYVWFTRANNARIGTLRIWSFVLSLSIVGVVQWFFLFFGTMEALDRTQSELDYFHKTKHYDDYSIYVRTADPGGMGRAFHYFYIQCLEPRNRYSLELLRKVDWMRAFTFDVIDGQLIIHDQGYYVGAGRQVIEPILLPNQPCVAPRTRAKQ